MIEVFVDTNIILRFLAKDNPDFFQKSECFFGQVRDNKKKGLISLLVVQEVVWVLEHYYKMKRVEFTNDLLQLLSLESIEIYDARKDDLFELLRVFAESKLDFVDIYLHLEAKRTNGQIFSYDEGLLRAGKGFIATA